MAPTALCTLVACPIDYPTVWILSSGCCFFKGCSSGAPLAHEYKSQLRRGRKVGHQHPTIDCTISVLTTIRNPSRLQGLDTKQH